MAEGLARLCCRLGVECRVYRSGWRWMKRRRFRRLLSRSRAASAFASNAWRHLQRAHLKTLRDVDAVVVIGHSPRAFESDFLDDELIRSQLPATPIILYDLVFLVDQPWWIARLHAAGNFRVDRYDWYLTASPRVKCGTFPAAPCTHVGLHLDDGSLYPNQGRRFVALLDFRRAAHARERELQVETLQATTTPFVELRGTYSIRAIRAIYRQSAIYFVAHAESFGLPIVELQACGATVLTPYADWCRAHQLVKNDMGTVSGKLSGNFVVYDNVQDLLRRKIQQLKDEFDPYAVRQRLVCEQPSLYYGSEDGVRDLLDGLQSGQIHSRLHEKHSSIFAI